MASTFTELETQLHTFEGLRAHEIRAIPSRIESLEREVDVQLKIEKELQSKYRELYLKRDQLAEQYRKVTQGGKVESAKSAALDFLQANQPDRKRKAEEELVADDGKRKDDGSENKTVEADK